MAAARAGKKIAWALPMKRSPALKSRVKSIVGIEKYLIIFI
jgi:hypothetical protein